MKGLLMLHNRPAGRLRARSHGLALATVLIVLMIVALLGGTIASLGIVNLNQVRLTQERTVVVHLVDGGLSELKARFNEDPTYGSDPGAPPSDTGSMQTSVARAEYWWTFDTTAGEPYCTNNLQGDAAATGYDDRTVPPRTALIFVSGDRFGRNDAADTITVGAVVSNFFPYAILTDGEIEEVEDISALPPFRGNVRSHVRDRDPNISLQSIDGHAFSTDGLGSIEVTGNPSGTPHYDVDKLTIPNFGIQGIVDGMATTADYQFSGNQDARTDGSGNLTIDGTTIPAPAAGEVVTIYVDDDLRFLGGATVAPGFRFFVDGDVRFNGSAGQLLSPEGDVYIFATGPIRFNGRVTATSMHLFSVNSLHFEGGNNHEFRGFMYVQEGLTSGPQGSFSVNGSGTFQGTLVIRGRDGEREAGPVRARNSDFVYDPSVLEALTPVNLSLESLEELVTLSWWFEN